MTNRLALGVLIALMFVGCRAMRVTGTLTDENSGEPLWPCTVTIGERVTWSDSAGRYKLKVTRKEPNKRFGTSRKMDVACKGYEKKSVVVSSKETRFPVVDLRLSPLGK